VGGVEDLAHAFRMPAVLLKYCGSVTTSGSLVAKMAREIIDADGFGPLSVSRLFREGAHTAC
jgi:hypothetical protein